MTLGPTDSARDSVDSTERVEVVADLWERRKLATLSRRLKRTRQALRTSIDAMSRARAGASADVLRAGLDLGQLDLDLAAALGGSRALEGK